MYFFPFIWIIAVCLVHGQIDILRDRTVNTKGETLSSSNSFPLTDSNNYWLIDLDNFDVIFELATESSTFNFIITSIVIQSFDGISDMCVVENIPSQQDYLVSYVIGGQERTINLNSEIGGVSANTLIVEIPRIPVDRITISKRVNGLGTYCMRYGLMGYEVARVSVLSYGMTRTNLLTDVEYTGLCGAGFCFGGKGRLTDGVTDTSDVNANGVGWSCPVDSDLPCIYNFSITLTTTTTINRIELLGLIQGSADYPIVAVEGGEVKYELKINGSLFVVTIPIASEDNIFNLLMTVQNGRNLILTEIAVFTGENINIAVESESYDFVGILSGDVSTSAPIANFQSERFVQQTVDPSETNATTTTTTTTITASITTQTTTQAPPQTTRVNNVQINTTQNTQQTTQNTTQTTQNTTQTTQNTTQTTLSPSTSSIEQCMTKPIFLSIIGTLGIFIITLLINGIIIVSLLVKNNRKIRRKLHTLEAKKGESFKKVYDFDTQQNNSPPILNTQITVIENMITTDDVYDSLEAVPVTRDSGIGSPNNVMLQRNLIDQNFFQQNFIPVTNSSCYIQPSHPKDERLDECPIVDENEVQMEENVAFRDTAVPQISVQMCESYKQGNLGIPMTENIGYMSSRSKQQLPIAPIQQENLGTPMTENIGYLKSRNGLSVSGLQNVEPKHIYASIANDYCIAIPDRNSEMTGYNVLKHK